MPRRPEESAWAITLLPRERVALDELTRVLGVGSRAEAVRVALRRIITTYQPQTVDNRLFRRNGDKPHA